MFDLSPMLCREVREPFDRPGWIFELKFDGFRTIAEVDGDGVNLYSRRLNSFNGRFSEIVDALGQLDHTAILDGEVVALDEDGHHRFEWLFHRRKSGKGKLVYFAFDLLYLDGEDLRIQPLHRRKSRLKRILKNIPQVIYVDHIDEHGKNFFALASKLGLEGIIAKEKRSRYVSGRESNEWLKIKNPDFQRKEPIEFRIERK